MDRARRGMRHQASAGVIVSRLRGVTRRLIAVMNPQHRFARTSPALSPHGELVSWDVGVTSSAAVPE